MEILSKSEKYNNSENEQCKNNNIFSEDNYKYIFNLKMNKIKEEIKDYIIDKYTQKIIKLNKDVNNIRKQLDDLTIKYINLIKIIIDNKNNINILNKNNIYIPNFINKSEIVNNNKIIKVKNEQKKDKTRIFYNNLEKIINDEKLNLNSNESKKNKTYNFDSNNMNMNYLKELNKKDLKKLNTIKNIIKKKKVSIKLLLNKECNKGSIYKKINIKKNDINNNIYFDKINSNESIFKINSNKNRIRNINNENIIINYLTFNTEENKPHKKKLSIQMNSTRRNGLFKQINKNFNNTISNSTEECSKIGNNGGHSTNKKNYSQKSKIKEFKTFFYKFGKINNSFNESFKSNSIENQNIFNNFAKSNYICNPIFGSFLDRIDNK